MWIGTERALFSSSSIVIVKRRRDGAPASEDAGTAGATIVMIAEPPGETLPLAPLAMSNGAPLAPSLHAVVKLRATSDVLVSVMDWFGGASPPHATAPKSMTAGESSTPDPPMVDADAGFCVGLGASSRS